MKYVDINTISYVCNMIVITYYFEIYKIIIIFLVIKKAMYTFVIHL